MGKDETAGVERETLGGIVGLTTVKGEKEGRWLEQDAPRTTVWPSMGHGQAEEPTITCCPSDSPRPGPSLVVPTTLTG